MNGELKSGLGSEVSHRPQGCRCTFHSHHHNAELPVHLSPSFRPGACVLCLGVGIGQAWERGNSAGAGCPEHVADKKWSRMRVSAGLGLDISCCADTKAPTCPCL
jgi:hypothetical protein